MTEGLVLLVLIWAVLLVPSALRARKASPHATVGGFERAMDVLRTDPGSRGGSRQVLVPGDAGRIVDREVPIGALADASVEVEAHAGPEPAHRATPPMDGAKAEDPMIARRRSRFVRLLVACGATLSLGVALGGWNWLMFTATFAVTAGYTVLLRRLKVQRDEARRVVADLGLAPPRRPEPAQAAVGGYGRGEGASVRLRRWDD